MVSSEEILKPDYYTDYYVRRSAFYIAGIITGVQGFLCFTMSESRPSLILARRLIVFHKATGRAEFKIFNPDSMLNFKDFLKLSIYRPIELLVPPQ